MIHLSFFRENKNKLIFILPAFFLALLFASPPGVNAQDPQDEPDLWRAEVQAILDEKTEAIPGINTETKRTVQEIRVELLEGELKGKEVMFTNDFAPLEVGDKVYLNSSETVTGERTYTIVQLDRRVPLFVLIGIFVATVILFGGFQGLRALLSLAGSLVVIFYVLLPLLLKGYPPVLVSTAVASLILVIAILFTHGVNKKSFVALGGTVSAVILTGIFALFAVQSTELSGFVSHEASYLNLNTRGELDFAGLLLGGIMIGILGILDDIAITQASVVKELFAGMKQTNRRKKKWQVYKKAMRVGREHVGALINTLVLAYVGVALPLLLFFYNSADSPLFFIIGREIFASEIVRAVVGSFGLILAVPITTLLATVFLSSANSKSANDEEKSEADEQKQAL